MKSASRVGSLVILFAVLAAGLFAFLQQGVWGTPTKMYWAKFDDAGGLNTGAEILLSGVQVGQVGSVTLDADGKALIGMIVKRDVPLQVGTVAVLPGSFIALGDKVMLLKPPAKPGPPLLDNDKAHPIQGVMQGPLDAMLPNADATTVELTKTMHALRTLLEDQRLKEGTASLLTESTATIDKFGGTGERINGLLDRNGDKIDSILVSVDKSMKNLAAVTLQVKKLASDQDIKGDLAKVTGELDKAASSGNALIEDLRAYTADTKVQSDIKDSVANVKDMTDSGKKIGKDFEKISSDGVTIAHNTADASAKVDSLLGKANDLVGQVGKAVDDARGAIQKFGGSEKHSLIPEITSSADLFRSSPPARLRADFTLGIPIGSQKYDFGIYDAFESNKLILQAERGMAPGLDLRYGVYASQPSIGVDYATASRFGLRADLYGLNDTALDVRARYELGGGVHAWLGVDRLFKSNTPIVGIGYRQ